MAANAGEIRARMTFEDGQFRRGMEEARRQMGLTNTAARRSARSINAIQNAAMAVGGAVAAGIGASVTVAANFEQAMARVKAVSGATDEQFAALESTARDLGATTVFSASQAAEGMGFLAMAGFDTNEIIAAMPGVLNLASAAQLDLASTADIASNILTGFGLEAGETGRVVDTLVQTMSTANTDLSQLGMAMKYVAPVAQSLGLSVEETAAAVGKMSDAGIQGSQAGTALRASLLSLANPTGQTEKAMERLNIQVTDAEGNMKPIPELVGHIASKLDGMTEAQETAAVAQLVGTEAASGFLALLEVGEEGLASYTNELENSAGAAEEVAKVQNDTLIGAFKEFQSALEEVGISVGNEFLPAFKEVVGIGTDLVRMFGELDPALVTTGLKSAGAAAGVALIGTAIMKLKTALNLLFVSMGPAGWLITGLSLAAGLFVGLNDTMARNNEVSLDAANALIEQEQALSTAIERYELLDGRMKLTNDELARFVDINSELESTSNPKIIERLKEEQEALAEKSGLTNDEMSEYLTLNDRIISEVPEATSRITDKGNALLNELDAAKELNREQREAIQTELESQKIKAKANRAEQLREERRLIADIKRLEEEKQEVISKNEDQVNYQIEQQQKLDDMLKNRNLYSEQEIQNQQIIVDQAGQNLEQYEKELGKIQSKLDKKKEDLTITREELATLGEVNAAMASIELAQVGLTAKKGEELDTINEAILSTQLQIQKINDAAGESGNLTAEQRQQLDVLNEQLGSYQAAKNKVSDIYSETELATAEASLLNENLGKYIDKKFDVEDQKPYAEDVNSTLAEYIFKNFDITDQNAYTDMINDKLMREIFKEFGITDKQSYVDWVNANLEKGIFKDFDVTDKAPYANNVNSLLQKYVFKDFGVTDNTSYANTINSLLSTPVTKTVYISAVETASYRRMKNEQLRKIYSHQGGLAKDARPKFHDGGSPMLELPQPNHNEVDVRILRNEMVITEAQQAQLFRMLDSYNTVTSAPTSAFSDPEVLRVLMNIAKNTAQGGDVYMSDKKIGEIMRPVLKDIEEREDYYKKGASGKRRRFYG